MNSCKMTVEMKKEIKKRIIIPNPSMRLSYHLFGLLFALVYLTGCTENAPRTNPLDPALGIRLDGVVQRSSNGEAIAQALLTVQPGERGTITNAAGEFSFSETFDPGTYMLICTKPLFAPDTMMLDLQSSKNAQFELNELPLVLDATVTSRYEARFLPPNRVFLEFNVHGSDQDRPGSLISADAELPTLSWAGSLIEVEASTNQLFFSRHVANDFGVTDLESMIGLPVHFTVKDAEGGKSSSYQNQLARIITRLPRPLEPSGTATMPFDFVWEPLKLPFEYTWTIEIYLNVGINLPPVDVIEGISSAQDRIAYNNSELNAQDYFWVLYIVDEFGNRSRSYETTLEIQ